MATEEGKVGSPVLGWLEGSGWLPGRQPAIHVHVMLQNGVERMLNPNQSNRAFGESFTGSPYENG